MKTSEIQKLSQAKNIQVESHNDEFTDKITIGISFNGHVWHWFTAYPWTDEALFDHTYSRNTGETKKGLSHRLEVYKMIERALSKLK